eukprot:TRINITY_DN5030_c0_g4_i1.p1 TRINITY_DN5030_c0_g4~~TRINITY_DN5030_c0_g4_i1.p1  ORF type:complete len:192 (-),score=69.48 TRINITY_DN5030_c0_g4_i1:41-550(-)
MSPFTVSSSIPIPAASASASFGSSPSLSPLDLFTRSKSTGSLKTPNIIVSNTSTLSFMSGEASSPPSSSSPSPPSPPPAPAPSSIPQQQLEKLTCLLEEKQKHIEKLQKENKQVLVKQRLVHQQLEEVHKHFEALEAAYTLDTKKYKNLISYTLSHAFSSLNFVLQLTT